VKVNKMCGYWGFKAISDERAHGDGRFSVNFGPMKLIFGPMERGEQGLSTEPLFSFIKPFLDLRKTRLRIEKASHRWRAVDHSHSLLPDPLFCP